MRIYKHYKTGDLYRYLTLAVHSENNEKLIVYKKVSTGVVYARPLRMFFEYVNNDGQKVRRFELVK